MTGITYTIHDTGTDLDGLTFTDGFLVKNHPQAGECVQFGTHKINGKDRTIIVRTAGKPDLQAIIAHRRNEVEKARIASIQEKWAAQIEQAKQTGKPVLINNWSYEGRGEDGLVFVDQFIRADGSVFETKTKTY